jgi:hypothetical protein
MFKPITRKCANPECQKEFIISNLRAQRKIYCSMECHDRVLYSSKYGCGLRTLEQIEKLRQLAKRQQDFSKVQKLKEACEVCGSTEHLLMHEVSYQPLETVTLCYSCHGILHHRFLKDKRVRPRYENGNVI